MHNTSTADVAYLIMQFLRDEGFNDTLVAFEKEVQLSDINAVCLWFFCIVIPCSDHVIVQPSSSPARSLREILDEYLQLKTEDTERQRSALGETIDGDSSMHHLQALLDNYRRIQVRIKCSPSRFCVCFDSLLQSV
jgi:hypothetical protein